MGTSFKCPGFRFKPTDDELVMYFLKKKLLGIKLDPEVIAEVNINDFSPWDLQAKSILSGDQEWYFFCPVSKKYTNGPRKNRATETGYWKGTGKYKEVTYKGRIVAIKKTLIFHTGHLPKGTRTDWVMHEFLMKDEDLANQGVAQEAYVLCRVFEKSGLGPKNGAQYGAPYEEKDWDDDDDDDKSTVTSSMMVSVLVNPDNVSGSSMKNITSNEPGPSTVTPSAKMLDPNNASTSTITSWRNERLTDVTVNDDVMVTSLQNNNTQEVEDRKGKKVSSEEDNGNGMYEELMHASNQHDLSLDMVNGFNVEEFDVGYDSLDELLDGFTVDDLRKLSED
ncbi:hypothetical protein L2E82_39660 [Cichorium intybus]|uniref:Uncharacterized protein n=1 Tax=Cichorium intybus TaxID=13427 RepID=A0ACB9AIB8_CICIN|nr:hypothetical protein L2E82_39660 [Cichorium intybus]